MVAGAPLRVLSVLSGVANCHQQGPTIVGCNMPRSNYNDSVARILLWP